ncbi:hypothetical protein [Rhodococcus sp. M8-35]|uniref:hypothetical protein n=1 Tax=Rhodococcus sp. M8-35 TaxID=3058401 RepID=UPI002ECFF7B0
MEIFVDEAKTTHHRICAVVVPSENLTPGPHDDADARGRTTAGRRHRRDERRREPAADRGRFRAHTGRFGRRTCSPRRSPAAPTGRSAGRLLAALAVHSTELGARRILVESCAQDKQDLAALTGALARVGAPPTVDRPHAHELLWAADLVACADTVRG